MANVVIAPAVQVTAAGRTHFLETGAIIPDGVAPEVTERLLREGLIGELVIVEVEEVPGVQFFTQADVDAAVQADRDATVDELNQARDIVAREAAVVAAAKADLETAKAAFEDAKAAAKAATPKPASKPAQQ